MLNENEDVQDQKPDELPEGGSSEAAPGGDDVSERLKKLEDANKESQRKITELATENATYRAIIEDRGTRGGGEKSSAPVNDPDIEEALTEAQLDPKAGGEKLQAVLRKRDALILGEAEKRAAERGRFEAKVSRLKSEKPWLKDFENDISPRVAQKIHSGVPWEQAIDEVVSDFETRLTKYTGKDTSLPKGAQGESGAGQKQGSNLPKAPQPETDDPRAWLEERKQFRQKREGAFHK